MLKVNKELASTYLALKAKLRAIETRIVIYSLLLQDKKGLQHLFRKRRYINLTKTINDDIYHSNNISALTHNPNATNPVSIKNNSAEEKIDEEHPGFEDDQMEDQSVSVIEMVKTAKEGLGKKFSLEDDIDRVADLFIQRFHNQIRLQKLQSQSPLSSYSSV